MSAYAGIHLLDTAFCIDNSFDYYIPPNLRRDILVGDFVAVPFGTANRKKIGLVVSVKDAPDKKGIECKSITEVCDKTMSLSDEALKLCFFLKEQTLCTLGDAVRAMIPTSALTRLEETYFPTEKDADTNKLDASALLVLEHVKKRESVTLSALKSKFGPATEMSVKTLVSAGLLKKDFVLKSSAEKFDEFCSLAISAQKAEDILAGDDEIRLRSKKHAQILRYLGNVSGVEGGIPIKDVLDTTDTTRAQLLSLCDKGLVKIEKRTHDRSFTFKCDEKNTSEVVLNEQQTQAYDTLAALSDDTEAHGALLFGVTGSGKTSVMIKLIDHVLKSGKSVILLLPEIALTPQTLSIFCSRYGERVAIIHSGLSQGERFDTHKKIKDGHADVIIGTRSAVFAPVRRLGLIIIDEEQEHTYKSDMNPKYHTRDVARFRCAYNGGLMLLASATPSFESYKKALDGTYTLVKLTERYGDAVLPEAIIEDMRVETLVGNVSPLGSALCSRLRKNASDGNQSILFINRRGYNNFISCRSCGEAIRCPQCSVSMTYHTSGSDWGNGYLHCHWCGRKLPVPTECPSCHGPHLARMGYGTQRIEQELGELLPDAKILRMDTDTTTEKSSYENLLGKFKRHEADVLLGTQMVTKGHDFPDVTLVGVLLADASLYLDDYRAGERTFAMLTQVIGRAGRQKKRGVAIIQTNNPDNECIKFACRQDYDAFYQSEIRLRKLLVFPPFCDIALLTLTCRDEKEVLKASDILSDMLKKLAKNEYSDLPLIIYGPFEAPVYKVEGKYRMRMVIKCKNNKRFREMLGRILTHFSSYSVSGLSLSADINPTNL